MATQLRRSGSGSHCRRRILTGAAALLLVGLFASRAVAATLCVATNGLQTSPYDTWATAFSNIQDAVDYAGSGDVVSVTNGRYSIGPQISITKGVTVSSVKGAEATVLDGGNVDRCLYVAHASAVVEGFTISGGNAASASPVNNGGGVYLASNGTVRACVISNNVGKYGSGVYVLYDGLLDRCVIRDNAGTVIGGGIYFYNSGTLSTGGSARNCLITGHSATTYGGGAYFFYGGQMDSCTVVGNYGNYGGGLFSLRGNSTWRNTIVYFNTASPDKGDNWYVNGGGVGYNLCTTPTRGTLCQTGDPLLTDMGAGDYRLRIGSPCIDAGQSNVWMAGALDLPGNSRVDPDSGKNDIGAYEYQAVPLAVGFTASPTEALIGEPIVFTATLGGSATNGADFLWDFDNDGLIDLQGPDQLTVTNRYGAGTYSVSLTVTNPAGVAAGQTNLDYITIAAAVAYAATDGGNVYPYTNRLWAATNIQDAIDVGMAGTVVWVDDGVYTPSAQITVADGVSVMSMNGAEHTTVDGGNAVRCFYMRPGAALDGFTITRGAGGVYFYYGGTVRNCTIVSNSISGSGGGTQSTTGGLLDHCEVLHNVATGNGGGSYVNGSFTIRNCLYSGNTATSYGGGVYFLRGGTVESSTIVGNSAAAGGGLLQNQGGAVRSSIVYGNTGGSTSNYWVYNASGVSYASSCTAPSVAAYGSGNITDGPLFRKPASGDYHLLWRTSPCINTGLYQSWMAGAVDLDGNDRILDGLVDMGAYEAMRPGGAVFTLR